MEHAAHVIEPLDDAHIVGHDDQSVLDVSEPGDQQGVLVNVDDEELSRWPDRQLLGRIQAARQRAQNDSSAAGRADHRAYGRGGDDDLANRVVPVVRDIEVARTITGYPERRVELRGGSTAVRAAGGT